jgi:AAA ATPase domain
MSISGGGDVVVQTLDALIGREREIDTLSAVLVACKPALVVIGGAVGMGKSALLGAMRERAREDGWFLIPDSDEALDVHEGISVASMQEALEDLLVGLNRGTDADPFAAPVPSDVASRSSPAVVTSLLAGARLTSAGGRFPGVGGLLDAMRQLAPIMIAFDVRMADRALRSWLTAKLWPTVRDAGITMAIVAVVVDQEDEQALARAATEVLHLGPLDGKAVRSHLETVTSGLPAKELDAYVEAIRHDPALLSSFSRLLPLVAAPTSSPAPESGGGSHF